MKTIFVIISMHNGFFYKENYKHKLKLHIWSQSPSYFSCRGKANKIAETCADLKPRVCEIRYSTPLELKLSLQEIKDKYEQSKQTAA